MNNYQTWLETPNVVRIAIIQVQVLSNGVSTTRYLSTHGVTVDGIQYLPIVKNTISIEESISVDYAASISFGDVELANNNGEYDSWLNDTWINKTIAIYVGSLPALGAIVSIFDFQLVFNGLVADIDSKSRTQLNLKLRDKVGVLNTSVSDKLLGNYNPQQLYPYTNQYQNSLKPIVFGEVHNITPLLTEPALLEYMVNDGPIEQIIEVRDNGRPVAFTTTGTVAIPPGSFRLLKTPVGTVTCSVQGINTTVELSTNSTSTNYLNTAANAIALLIRNYGIQLGSFIVPGYISSGYLLEVEKQTDAPAFNTLGKQPIGMYLSSRANVLNTCQEIAKSCGLVLTSTRLGFIKLVDLDIPVIANTEITDSDIFLNSLQLSQKLPVIAGVKLGYAKNWTVQTNLLTEIPQQHKDLFATEWLQSSQANKTAEALYNITTEPELESTYLIDKADADLVASKKLNLFSTPRKIYTMTCTGKFLSLELGSAVKLSSARFGLAQGVFGLVVSIKPNWLRGTVELGVLV